MTRPEYGLPGLFLVRWQQGRIRYPFSRLTILHRFFEDLKHRAGQKLFIYFFCGPTVPVVDPDTGEVRRVAIFVAVMGVSNYTCVEACE